MLYNPNGLINLTTVTGSSYTGIYASDGSWNIVLNDGTQTTGRYHPCGALNAFEIISPVSSYNAPNGSIYVVNSNSTYLRFNPSIPFPTVTLPTNLVSHSEAFDLWTSNGMVITSDVALAPYTATLTADRLSETATLTAHSLNSDAVSYTIGNPYTLSVYCKYETAQFVQLLFGSGAFGVNSYANFDIQNGVVGTVGSTATAAITSTGSGWYRCSITSTSTATASSACAIGGANSSSMTRALSYTGVVSNTRLFANAQIETGSVANRYVPTA